MQIGTWRYQLKEIETMNAVGSILCHDITQIIQGVTKQAIFRKGHVVAEEDIETLLSLGKDHLFVWEKKEGYLHENEAAEQLCKLCFNENMSRTEVKEGKIELIAMLDGLFQIDRHKLFQINCLDEISIAARHSNTPVKLGDKLAGMRVIPLIISKERLNAAKELAGSKPIFRILPYRKKKIGIVTTGNEIYYGRIRDTFGAVIQEKFMNYPAQILSQVYVPDEKDLIRAAIIDFILQGADIVVCTGGMSVDPDDRTPGAILSTGAQLISYGAPVLPGAMMLVSYYDSDERRIPILGLPGCVMYAKNTIFDVLLPHFMADHEVKKEDLASLGEGGLCLECEHCVYPNCGFGKGG